MQIWQVFPLCIIILYLTINNRETAIRAPSLVFFTMKLCTTCNLRQVTCSVGCQCNSCPIIKFTMTNTLLFHNYLLTETHSTTTCFTLLCGQISFNSFCTLWIQYDLVDVIVFIYLPFKKGGILNKNLWWTLFKFPLK